MSAPIVVFDIETVPDAAALRAAGLADPGLDEAATVEQAQQRRREATAATSCRSRASAWSSSRASSATRPRA